MFTMGSKQNIYVHAAPSCKNIISPQCKLMVMLVSE